MYSITLKSVPSPRAAEPPKPAAKGCRPRAKGVGIPVTPVRTMTSSPGACRGYRKPEHTSIGENSVPDVIFRRGVSYALGDTPGCETKSAGDDPARLFKELGTHVQPSERCAKSKALPLRWSGENVKTESYSRVRSGGVRTRLVAWRSLAGVLACVTKGF